MVSVPYPTLRETGVLPGPLADDWNYAAPAALRASMMTRARAWDPARAKPIDIQAGVIGGEDAKLLRWAATFDLAANRWPVGWAADEAAIALAWIYDQRRIEEIRPALRGALVMLKRQWEESDLGFFNSVTYNRSGAAAIWCGLAYFAGQEQTPDDHPLWEWVVSVALQYMEAWPIMLDGGAWPEGWTYWGQGGKTVYQVLAAIDSAYGTTLLAAPWLRDTLRMLDYLVQPDGTAVPFGDQHTHLIAAGVAGSYQSFEALRETAIATRDAYALQHLDVLAQLGAAPPLFPWGHWKTPAREAWVGANHTLPKMRVFRGAGVVSTRDSWISGEDATQITMLCGGDKVSHQSASCGHFEIFSRGLLAGDAGCYALGAMSEQAWIARRDWGWNTLRIYDAADRSNEHFHRCVVRREGSRDIFAEVPLPRDGGQKRIGSGWRTKALNVSEWRARAEEYQAGRIISATHSAELDDVRCDLTACYRSYPDAPFWSGRTNRVEMYERRFLYVRTLGVLVVADLLRLTKPELTLEFVTHTREQPTFYDGGGYEYGRILLRRSALVEYEYGVPRGLRYATPDRKYQYDGRAVLRCLTPMAGASIEITGPESWSVIDGRSYTGQQQPAYQSKPEWHPTDPTKGPVEACGWRIACRYPSTGETLRGLVHMFSIGRDVEGRLEALPDGGRAVVFPSVGRRLVVHADGTSAVEDWAG